MTTGNFSSTPTQVRRSDASFSGSFPFGLHYCSSLILTTVMYCTCSFYAFPLSPSSTFLILKQFSGFHSPLFPLYFSFFSYHLSFLSFLPLSLPVLTSVSPSPLIFSASVQHSPLFSSHVCSCMLKERAGGKGGC